MTIPSIAAQALVGLRPPRAILFDWDNTLVDTWATIHDALNFLMRAMDRAEWSLAETRERVRLSLREAFPLYFGERWEEARDIYLDAVPRNPSGTVDAAARARIDVAQFGGAGDLSRRGQQQDRRPAAAGSRASRLDGLVRQHYRSWRRAA